MRSLIKLYGPPVLEAIKALQKIAVDFPEVCIMDKMIETDQGRFGDPYYIRDYFNDTHNAVISIKRCSSIISHSGQKLGEYDFYFEWFTDPTWEQLENLIKKIDESLTPLGVRYSITTK